ncbi:hypothetical protein [Bergeyella porcorum]
MLKKLWQITTETFGSGFQWNASQFQWKRGLDNAYGEVQCL